MSITKISNDLIAINSNQMDNNSFILIKDKKAIIIDPSFAGDQIIKAINDQYKVVAILLTHAHFDHCFDVAKLIKVYNCPVYLNKEDKQTYEKYNCADWLSRELPSFDKNINYFNSNELKIDGFNIQTILTPGHTTGCTTYIWNNYVFVGDTLFFDSCGRSDLLNSNHDDMIKSLQYLFDNIKPEQLVLPGHGKWDTMKNIKAVNYVVADML